MIARLPQCGLCSGSPALRALSASPGGSVALAMAVPRLSMRSRAVVAASSSVRHALRPVVRRRRRICPFPNGYDVVGGVHVCYLQPSGNDLARSDIHATHLEHWS
eukprot:4983774-Pyramimonas_sp.AAC.1